MIITPREAAVRDLTCAGMTSKEAGLELKLSPRTVEVYRDRLRKKYGARNTAELVRMVLLGETSKVVNSDAGS